MKYLVFFSLVMLVSCGKSLEQQNEELFDEVMKIHDEVMPEMGAIRKTRKAVLELQEASEDSTLRVQLLEVSNQLDEANEAMMNWMRNFEPDFQGTPEERKQYLDAEKKKMIEVRDMMLGSLQKGNDFLSASTDM